MMKLFVCKARGVDQCLHFDPFVRSEIVSSGLLATIRAFLCLYCFTTIITAYAWLAHRTASFELKDINVASYTIQQSRPAIGQTFSFFSRYYQQGVQQDDTEQILSIPIVLGTGVLLSHLEHINFSVGLPSTYVAREMAKALALSIQHILLQHYNLSAVDHNHLLGYYEYGVACWSL